MLGARNRGVRVVGALLACVVGVALFGRCLMPAGGAVERRDGWFGILTCLRFAACPGYPVSLYLVLRCSCVIVTEV
jgi:hypothetical protein